MNRSYFFLIKSIKLFIFVKIHTNSRILKFSNCYILNSNNITKTVHKMCSNSETLTNKFTADTCRPNNNTSRVLVPPESCKEMKVFNKDAFTKICNFPSIFTKFDDIGYAKTIFKGNLLKLNKVNPVQILGNDTDISSTRKVMFILNPDQIKSFNDFDEITVDKLKTIDVGEENFTFTSVTVTFENWKIEDIISAVLPDDLSFSGYSIIGHIAHLNLRPELYEYKNVLGEVLLTKMKNIKTVINKLDVIDNTYRNFKMELVCGENNMKTRIKQSYLVYELDFATVYWNPRLSTEHERVVNKLSPKDILCDVFAGIGPFVIPAAKKGCNVLCNDLNPDAIEYLKRNLVLNKIPTDKVEYFNRDAKDFILINIKNYLLNIKKNQSDIGNTDFDVHITMNLPATAVSFLNYFKGLFTKDEIKLLPNKILIHLYCFVKGKDKTLNCLSELAKNMVENEMNCNLSENINEITKVRHVAPNKFMMRVSFVISSDMLIRKSEKRSLDN